MPRKGRTDDSFARMPDTGPLSATTTDAPTADDANRPLFAGRFRMGARRGRATDSAVHDAYDEQTQRMVVVRMLHPQLSARPEVRQRVRGTAQALAAMRHPHVARVIDWGAADWRNRQVLYIATEHLAGGSLADILDRGRMLSPSQALIVGLDACKALDALHRAGIVHGDVRPSTIVFDEERSLRLIDAGISTILTEAAGGVGALSNDIATYVAPERATGGQPEPVSDVYSLCLTLVESITGAVPFAGDSTVATLANRVDKLLPVSADFGALASVLERAGRPAPADRSTAAVFGRDLVNAAPRLPRPVPLPIVGGAEITGSVPVVTAAAKPATPSRPPTAPSTTAELPATAASPASEVTAVLPVTKATPASGRAGSPPRSQDPTGPRSITAVPPDDDDDAPGWWTTPRGKRGLIAAIAVVLLVGGGLVWLASRPARLTVPDVVGLELAAAVNQLADFEIEQVDTPDDVIPVGGVVRTDPAAGSSAAAGSTVAVFVSTGPKPRELPELNGLTRDEAQAALDDLGLVAEFAEPAFNEGVEEGRVISWTVPGSPTLVAGDTVLRGTTVQVVVSAGRAPRDVPDLSGLGFDAAKSRLDALELVIERGEDVFSETVPAGQIAAQDPAPGTPLQPGEVVRVSLSKGPDTVAFPDLSGLDSSEAIRQALEAAGFTVGPIFGNPNLEFQYPVVDGGLATTGQLLPRGTEVTLVFAN